MDISNLRNGPRPQTNGAPVQQPSASRAHLLRIPTVREALPFTPFSSIVPFNPEHITPALALPSTTPTAFEYADDIQSARSELERLSNGARKAEDASKRCQQTLRDVQRLLDPETITQFKFKTTKKRSPIESGKAVKEPELSSFAKMVLDTTNVSFRYLAPDSEAARFAAMSSPNVREQQAEDSDTIVVKSRLQVAPPQSSPVLPAKAMPASQQSQQLQQTSQVQIPRAAQQIQRPHSVTAHVQIPNYRPPSAAPAHAGLAGSQQASPVPSQLTPAAFVVPTKVTPSQLAEYQTIAAPSNTRDSTPTRNQGAYLTNGARAVSLDQRVKANQATESLQSLLQEIFAAEDQLEPDTSGDVSVAANICFTTREGQAGNVPVLRSDIQARLDSAVQKVVALGRLDEIEVDQLSRVQKLCENAISVVASALLEVGDDWQEQDVVDWQTEIDSTLTGLLATRTMMRIMTGGSHHRELQSEDYLRVVLEAIRAVVERCIVPVVECRPQLGERIKGEKNAPRNPRFEIAHENKKLLQTMISATTKCFKLLGDLFVKLDMDESGVSNVEYTCKALLFAQTGLADKDCAVGSSWFERLRIAAMDVLARIFAKYTEQRNFIIDEILLSLEKLPATKQSARQFQLNDAKPIQLVSALLMRLVQTSATTNSVALNLEEDDREEGDSDVDDSEEDESDGSDTIKVSSKRKKGRKLGAKAPYHDLRSIYEPLKSASQKHAGHVVSVLLQRASSVSKSSTDEPYRKLLDIFVEDFLNVLSSSDWPAAEILLRTLVSRMVVIAENAKSPAPSRTLALELLGIIGSGVLDVQTSTISAAKAFEVEDSTSSTLVDVAGLIETGELVSPAITAFDGPYRVVLEYLHSRGADGDPQLQTARGYHLVQWAELVCAVRESSTDDRVATTTPDQDLQAKIRHMIEDVHYFEGSTQASAPSTAQGKFAAKILASTSPLARAFNRIFNVVLHSMSSEQPTVRSRALKSVTTLLDQEPSILDRNSQVLAQIVRCMGDPSPLVRESALSLVSKCVSLRPALELKVYERIIARTTDAHQNVRKRSMAFLKQVYFRNSQNQIRAVISNALISRIKDSEESVAEAALTAIEEVWFSAFQDVKPQTNVDSALRLQSHAVLIIQTVDLGDNVAIILQDLIRNLLTKSKQKSDNFKTAKLFVSTLFDGVIEPKSLPGEPAQADSLRALEVFGKAAPKLFTAAQIEHLVTFTQNIATSNDLEMFHSSTAILRCTLPVLTGVSADKLRKILTSLVGYTSKLPTSELSVAAPCIQTIGAILGQNDGAMVRVRKALENVNNKRDDDLTKDTNNVAGRLLTIIGQMGKACNFEKDLAAFKAVFPTFQGKSVATLMVQVCCQFTSPRHPLLPREAALEAVCEICQSFPENFLRADVVNAMEEVFNAQDPTLEGALLASLEGFFAKEEDDAEASEILGTGIESGAQRLGGTYQAKGYDSASASLSQRFLKDFLRIALSSIDENAFCAARIVGWINERGMAHPGESGPGLVALQTCPGPAIAKLAFTAYMQQYTKHENVFEKTLVKSIQQAFEYQLRVVKDSKGYSGQPFTSKLHFFWQTLKNGKAKVRTKLFTNVCAVMNFDAAKLDLSGTSPQHLLFVRFCVENFAFLEFERAEEILHLLACLEKTFAGTGTALLQAIESELLNLHVPVLANNVSNDDGGIATATEGPAAPAARMVDPSRLRELAVSAQILSLMWETRSHLRRLWNLQKHAGKHKGAAKEPTKLTRATNAPVLTENYLSKVVKIMSLDDTDAARLAMCTSFVELFSVDNEVKVGGGEDADDDDDLKYDEGADDRSESSSRKSPSVGATPRGKKRKSLDSGGRPAKKRSRPRKSSSVKITKGDSEEDEGGWI